MSKRALGAHAAFLFLVKDLHVHEKFCRQSHFRMPAISQSVFKGRVGWAPDTKLCFVKLFFDLRGEFAIQPESLAVITKNTEKSVKVLQSSVKDNSCNCVLAPGTWQHL